MAESEKANANRPKLREKRRLKRERTADTPEAVAERRRKQGTESVEDAAVKRIGGGVLFS